MKKYKSFSSAVVIGRLLCAEGFTDRLAHMIEKYWKTSVMHGGRRTLSRMERMDSEISELCKNMTEAQKLLLGRFIGLHKRMSFDAGLRIGLAAYAVKVDKIIEETKLPAEEGLHNGN